MPTGSYIHIFSVFILTIMLVSNLLDPDKNSKQNKLMSMMLLMDILLCLICAAMGGLAGKSELSWLMKLLAPGLCLSSLILFLFCRYIRAALEDPTIIPKWIQYGIPTMCLLSGLGYLLSFFFPCFFFIENATYQLGPFWFVDFVLALNIYCQLAYLLFLVRKQLTGGELVVLSIYVAFPAAALLVQLITGFDIIQYTTTLLMCIVYISFHAQRSKRLAILEKELTDALVKLMVSQIQPHFINNTLYNIKALCETNPETAAELVDNFAQYLRGNLNYMNTKGVVPFAEEVKHLKYYLAIEQERFEGIYVVWQLKTMDFTIPPLTLQPLVENAIKYGLRQKEEGGTITVTSMDADSSVVLLIIDDGVGFDTSEALSEDRVHIGIANTRERIEKMCGGTLEVESTPGIGTAITITIPKSWEVNKR